MNLCRSNYSFFFFFSVTVIFYILLCIINLLYNFDIKSFVLSNNQIYSTI